MQDARPQGDAITAPRLEVRNLSKTFAGVTVLDSAYLSIAPGEIHALVGQNGSGKSTLIKLISGVYRADAGGEILLDGRRIGAPVDARRLHGEGLAFVHQDLGLVSDLSVRENVRVGRHAVNRLTRRIDVAHDRQAVRDTFAFLGVDIDPETPVAALSPSQRVAVAVARALQDRRVGSGVIVFDESSRSIPRQALPDFYAVVRLLAEQGTAVLIVSHDLAEVLHIAHRATALRNGRVVETGVPTSELDEAALTRLVLGREGELDDLIASVPTIARDETIELIDVAGGRLRAVSTRLQRGEVLGVTGTVDSGLSTLGPVLGGDLAGTGSLVVDGRVLPLAGSRPAELLALGVAFIPQDRAAKGLATALTIEENVTLPHLRHRGARWWTGRRWQRAETDDILHRFGVTPARRSAVVATLSGGNQQKILLGKWLLGGPRLLVLDDPTQAVDVGARRSILRAARAAAAEGAAVIVCSAEIDDLAAICDRVLVLEAGVVVRELRRPFSADDILAATFSTVGSTP